MDDEERKKKLARLSGGLLDDAAVPGASSDVVNLSLQLNPKLLENRQASDVMKEVEQASNQRGSAHPVAASALDGLIGKNDDLAKLVQGLHEKIKGERERIVREEKRLQEEKKTLNAKGLERVIEAVVTIDPNMVSPYTLMVLEDHKQFLRELGFDVRKVQERRKALGR